VLYINDSRRRHIRAFELLPNGTLARQTDRVFADLGGSEPGVPDGMKVDVEGNVYCAAPAGSGSWIRTARTRPHRPRRAGHHQHRLGGDDWKTLYFTSRGHLGSVNVKIPASGAGRQEVAARSFERSGAGARGSPGGAPAHSHGDRGTLQHAAHGALILI